MDREKCEVCGKHFLTAEKMTMVMCRNCQSEFQKNNMDMFDFPSDYSNASNTFEEYEPDDMDSDEYYTNSLFGREIDDK